MKQKDEQLMGPGQRTEKFEKYEDGANTSCRGELGTVPKVLKETD